MPEQLDDAAIANALLALAADLALPDVDDFTARVLAQLPTSSPTSRSVAPRRRSVRHRRRRWSVAVATIVAATTATTLAIPDARAAVAEWLGIDGVRIVRVEQLPPAAPTTTAPEATTPTDAQLLAALGLEAQSSLESAAASLGLPLRRPTLDGLGPADLIGSGATGRPVQLAQVWRTRASLAGSTAQPDVAILLTQLQVGLGGGGFQKMLPRGAVIEQVTVDGRPAWWITGDLHELTFLGANGQLVVDSSRLAGDTLLWTADGITYRLESSLGQARSIAFAECWRNRSGNWV